MSSAAAPAAALCIAVVASVAPLRAQCPDGSPPPCTRAAAPGPNSVAVLAFRNVTEDPAFAYLGEGLSSEITTSLAGVSRLEVRSPGVVRAVQRGATADPRALGRQLNVRYVVEGDYQRGGDRVRIAVRLVAVSTGTQRWGSAWTRQTADLLSVQEEIARQVATAIAGELLPGERQALASPTSDAVAWDRFLRGNFALRQRDLAAALAEYGAAIALDSAFGRAWARMAYVYGLALDRNEPLTGAPPESLLARGTRAADRALAADARSSDAWMARGMLAQAEDPLGLAGSREAFERAVALDPRNEEAWHQYGSLLAYLGQDSAAFVAWRRTLELDPRRPQTLSEITRLYYFERRVADAEPFCRDSAARELDTRGCVGIWLRDGDTARAVASINAMDRAHGHLHPDLRVAITGIPLSLSDPWVQTALRRPSLSCYEVASSGTAAVWLAAGQPDSALAALARCTPRGPRVWFYLRSPIWDPARSDPRFQAIWNETRPPGAQW